MDTSLAPGYAKVTYNGSLFPHHMTIPIKFDGTPTPGVEPSILLKDASSAGISSALDDMFDVIVPFFNTGTAFGLVEVHAVDDVTGDDTFIWGYNMGRNGTSAVANKTLAEDVWSFKLVNGGLYKLYLMEDVQPVNVKTFPPYAAGVAGDLSDFISGPSSPVYGRTNSYPFSPISETTKTNDSLRKQHGLS